MRRPMWTCFVLTATMMILIQVQVQGFLINKIPSYTNIDKRMGRRSGHTPLLNAKKGKKIKRNSISNNCRPSSSKDKKTKRKNSSRQQPRRRPKMIVFDLDGCLWKPELFELISTRDGRTTTSNNDNTHNNFFFTTNPKEKPYPGTTLLTPTYQRLELLGATRSILWELYYNEDWIQTAVGISSRTDRPNWAYEAMDKFVLYPSSHNNNNKILHLLPTIKMKDVFAIQQLCILDRNQNKVDQFETIQENFSKQFCNVKFKDMLFFDNEAGNCKQISNLGVTTVYCPHGLTQSAWEEGLSNFPLSSGKVIGPKMPY